MSWAAGMSLRKAAEKCPASSLSAIGGRVAAVLAYLGPDPS